MKSDFDTVSYRTAHPAADAAAHWLATLSDENCSEAERQQFLEWLRASTRHIEEFLRLSTLARSASKRELWPDESVSALVAAARASSNVAALATNGDAEAAAGRRRFVPWAIAASIAGMLALGIAYFVGLQWPDLLAQEYRTALGEQRSITLEDGSVVQLNSRSRLRTRFSKALRAVELLDGEAIFRVAADSDRPFRVRTGATDIVAVGTAFNVNADETRTIVTVLEGRVRVNNRVAPPGTQAPDRHESQNIELARGEQLIVARARPVVRLALRDTEKVTSWTERRLIFEDTTVAAAAAEFARYSPRRIRIEDAQIGARRINGVFEATDPASLAEFLSADETVDVRADNGGWIVGRRELRPQ